MPTDAAMAVSPVLRPETKWLKLTLKFSVWLLIIAPIIYYIRRDALHYLFSYTPDSFKRFWPRRILMRTHVACAITMISAATLQLWIGLRMRHMTLHTWLGRIFLVVGTVVSCTALYMGLHPIGGGPVFGFGLFLNGLFWLVAAAVAYYAIRIRNIEAHKEWMIRVYILTYAGIVGDRIIPDMTLVARHIGADALNDISGWANWAVPLMVAEVVFQIRRFRKTAQRRPSNPLQAHKL